METRLHRWGNSLGLRIPKAYAEEAHVEEGSTVDVSYVGGNIVIRPMRKKKYDIHSLVKAIKPDNVHAAIETGPPAGREAW